MKYVSTQQQNIVKNDSKFKLINGCAGSCKTDTLIKCAMEDLIINNRPILFLTLVGSVSHELKNRLEKTLSIRFTKSANHFISNFNDVPIVISNFDSWVHNMLSKNKVDMEDIGDDFKLKTKMLYELTSNNKKNKCFMKSDDVAELLLIDEAQDLSSIQMKIVTNLTSQKSLDVYIAGDYLQSLFIVKEDELSTIDVHSMNIFKILKPTYFDLNICFRCPKAHCDFNNLLLSDMQKKYGLPEIISSNDNIIDKPVIFTHYAASQNSNSHINAEQVSRMIDTLMNLDSSITPGDIAIIMGKSNENVVYEQLLPILNKMYMKRGYVDSVIYMTTKADGYHNSLNWAEANDKTVMVSIHGDKGKGHKVVFFLGFTERSIPQDRFLYKSTEIISESLLNVATTRSTKYLFIGFYKDSPSRYLEKYKDKIDNYAYIAWKDTTNVPEPYKSIINSYHSRQPSWDTEYRTSALKTGFEGALTVKRASCQFDQANEIIDYQWKANVTHNVFGLEQTIKTPFKECHYIIMGLMSEILMLRILQKDRLVNLLKKYEGCKIVYTDDERLLSFMYDVNDIKNLKNFDAYLEKYDEYFKNNVELKNIVIEYFKDEKKVVHSIFKTDVFKKNFEDFISDVPNNMLMSSCVWNITLFYNQLTSVFYKPAIYASFGYFNEDLSKLNSNIEMFIDFYLTSNNIKIEQSVEINGVDFNDAELRELEKLHHSVSLKGRYDILNDTTLIELKASKLNCYSQHWLNQVIIYASMLQMKKNEINEILIVNILKGECFEWDITKVDLSIEKIIEKVSEKYEFHEIEKNSLLKTVKLLKDS